MKKTQKLINVSREISNNLNQSGRSATYTNETKILDVFSFFAFLGPGTRIIFFDQGNGILLANNTKPLNVTEYHSDDGQNWSYYATTFLQVMNYPFYTSSGQNVYRKLVIYPFGVSYNVPGSPWGEVWSFNVQSG